LKKLNELELEDLLTGAKILGTGGGGSAESGRKMIKDALSHGKEFKLADFGDLPQSGLAFIISKVGGGVPKEVTERLSKLPRVSEETVLLAKRELARYLNEQPYTLLPSEIGAGNTIVPMYVAAMSDIPALDADCCGRAKPEISISTTTLKGIPSTPLSMATPFGDILILKSALDDERAEDLCRHVALASGGLCGVARTPARVRSFRDATIQKSISRCIRIGEELRKAREKGRDPVAALIDVVKGFELFRGEVTLFEREERGAFMWGNIQLRGSERFEGHNLRIWFKNEHLISWKDGRPFVTCPDAICIVDEETCDGLSNFENDFRVGRRVAVVGVPAPQTWREPKGLEIFGPRHFGYEIPYNPIENIVRQS
jgi:hypothetical protein